MNVVIGQTIRCTLSLINEQKNWVDILSTVELAINSLPNHSIGYVPFFLNYGYHPIVPVDLIDGTQLTQQESVSQFCKRMKVK